jgi:endo-1,4-beta-D-glucanase Y
MEKRLLGYGMLGAAVLLLLCVLYVNSTRSTIPLVFSPTQVLNTLWNSYKQEYLEPGTSRTLDKQRANVTTSEGQSYTMLRAVWVGDKKTFDEAWTWTKNNLDRPDDRLLSWLFGQRPDGSYGVLTAEGGDSTASDADTDIAMALVFAFARWQDPGYLGDARVIIHDIWEKEVIEINGKPYLTANNFEKFSSSTSAIINPSYLAPYAYRIFSFIDPSHNWSSVVDSSYDIIERSMDASLGSGTTTMPPDWVRIDKKSGTLLPPTGGLTTNFGYDAMRTPWRMALDYAWYQDGRAKNILDKMSFLSDTWNTKKSISTTYTHAGEDVSHTESPAVYGGTIGYFLISDPSQAKEVYEQKLQFLFDPNRNTWKDVLSYYDDNWAWFGIGLYNNLLPNLFTTLPPKAYEI